MLREVDVGVDEAREHERVPVVVRRERSEALRKARGGTAPGDAPVRADHDRAPTVEPDRAPRPGDRRIVAIRQHRAANDPTVPPIVPPTVPGAAPRTVHRGWAAIQAPRRERSASVMPVVLPSGMTRFCTV